MQGMKPSQDLHRRDSKSVANLMETAKTMLKNGETSDVTQFAQATLDEITAVVIPAIADARRVDQEWLDGLYQHFGDLHRNLGDETNEIRALQAERSQASQLHQSCRETEDGFCQSKVQCDYDLFGLWRDFVTEEQEVRGYEAALKGHFCQANGTLATWRNQAKLNMEPWLLFMDSWTRDGPYDIKIGDCERKYTLLEGQTEVCDGNQASLENAACAHANKVRQVREDFALNWQAARLEYEGAVEVVKRMYEDRVHEVLALGVVQCLLNRVTIRNGRPCESTDEATAEFTHCEEERLVVDITWLNHTYHCEQDPPQPFCLCPVLPEIPSHPCSQQFVRQEYAALPDVPQPAFHDQNSHCNQRPPCQSCSGAVDTPEDIDWSTLCSGTLLSTTTTTTTLIPEGNCPDPFGNFRVCSMWGDPHFSHVFYQDAAAAQEVHRHGRRGNAFGTMMGHHEVGVYDLARSNDGSFAAQAFFCHADMARATTSVNGLVVNINGQRTSFIRGSRTGPRSGSGENHANPAVGGDGDDIYDWIDCSPGLPKEATDINVNGDPVDWDTLGDGDGGGTMRGCGTHVSTDPHQGRAFGDTMWVQQLHPTDRVSRTMAPVCMGDVDRTKTVSWSLPQFFRVYEPIVSIYMENSTIAPEGLCGSEDARSEPPMQTSDDRWMFEANEISQICNVCGMVPDETYGCVNPVPYTPPENVHQICAFNNVDHDVAQGACENVDQQLDPVGEAAWLEACIQEYCANQGLEPDEILAFLAQMMSDSEEVSLVEEGSASFQVFIGKSEVENEKCVHTTVPNLLCDVNSGHPGIRINADYANAPDTFHVTVNGFEVCARRTDAAHGWGMNLQIQCQIPAPADLVYVFIDRSEQNTKCVDTAEEVHCSIFAGDLNNRVNNHPAGDRFHITTTPNQVCATRVDSNVGWGMRLQVLCNAGPAPADLWAPGSLAEIFIDRSDTNQRCVSSEIPAPVVCAANAGDLGRRLNDHPAADTFEISVDGLQVCARRTDSDGGWGMRLRISCAVAGTTPEWTPAVVLGGSGNIVDVDHGENEFNQLFNQCPVVRYTRNGDAHSVYVRRPSAPWVNGYSLLTYTWSSENNALGTDFDIYDSLEDARSQIGQWTFCNYDDPDVGYPRDCGRNGKVDNTWFSFPAHSQVSGQRFDIRGISAGASFEVYTGTDCPTSAPPYTQTLPGQKCPHQHGDRLFREPSSGSSAITLQQCYEECLATEGCLHFSHGAHGGGNVCMGCTTLAHAQTHAGFDAYDMA